MDIHIKISNRGAATIAAGIAAVGMLGYLWKANPRDEIISYKPANAAVSVPYETGQTSGVARAKPVMVQYNTKIHNNIAALRQEEKKAKRARKIEFEKQVDASDIPEIKNELQCGNSMSAQLEEINGQHLLRAYCPEEIGASGSFNANVYRLSGGSVELYASSAADQNEISRLQWLLKHGKDMERWDAMNKLGQLERSQSPKIRASSGRWQKIYMGGNFAVSDEIVNGMPVLYEDTDIFLGEGSQVERRKPMLVKHVFNGREYKAIMKIIDRDELAQGVTSVVQSSVPNQQKEKQFHELQETFGPDAVIDAFSYAEGIDAVSAQQLQTYLNATGAYAEQAQLKTPAGLALFFAGRVIHHATADTRYKNETIELSGNFPRLAQWIRDNGEIPDPGTRSQLMRDNWSANYETPPKPFRANNTVAVERSSSPYGSTERYRFAPGSNPSQVEQLKRNYAIQQDRQRIENNRQDFYNSPVGRNLSGAENAARSFGGAAINAGRQAAPQVQQRVGKALADFEKAFGKAIEDAKKKKN